MLFSFLLTILSQFAHAETHYLGVGHFKNLPVAPSSTVQVEKGRVLQVKAITNGIEVKGLKAGRSYIKVNQKKYHFTVTNPSIIGDLKKLRKALRPHTSIKADLQNQSIVVSGELKNFNVWKTLAQSGVNYKFRASVSRSILIQVKLFFSELLRKNKIPKPRIQWQPLVKVTAGGKTLHLTRQLELLFKPYGIEVEHLPSEIEIRPTVRVKVHIAEVNRQWSRQLGLKWPGTYTAKVLPLPIEWQNIDLTLSAMESSGSGQVLAAPTLVSRSGGEANFLAGGEFPIRVSSYYGKNVVWKKHGVVLKLKPVADFNGRIQIEVSTEVSLVDQSNAVDGLPAMKTNRVSTEFDLAKPQTIYLSGLIQQTTGSSSEGWPGLKDIPILGLLFGSKAYQNNETELVIF